MKMIRILLLSLLAALLTGSFAAAAEMEAFYQKDTVVASGYTVRDLYSGTQQSFDYEVPEDGVAVLMFFGGQCPKSSQTLRMFAESQWIDHNFVEFYAVESSNTAQATVINQLKTAAGSNASRFHPVLGGNPFLFDYVHKVFPTLGTISYPFVLLISNVGDTPYIRYASQDQHDLEFYSTAIESLLAEHYETEGNLVYRIGDSSAEVVGYTGSPTDLTIPTHVQGVPVTSIARGALQGCQTLTSVTVFPITSTVGPYAFADCPNLYRADLGGCQWELPEGLFSGCSNLAVCQLESTVFSIGKSAFEGCSQLQALLGWNALENLTIIKESAFSGCRYLNVTLPQTVQILGDQAFQNSGVTTVTLPGSLRTFGVGVFQNCTALTSATLKSGLTTVPQSTFSGCTALQSVSLPAGLTSVGREAFRNCSSLSAVTLPEALTTLEREAFTGSGLTNMTVPGKVSTLGYAAFRSCTKLTSAVLPESLTELPESLFSGCTALTSAPIPKGVTELPPTLFESCRALTDVEIPEGVTTIGTSAFSDCRAMTTLSLPDALETIDSYAFSGCEGLTVLTLPAGLTTMEKSCFSGCDNLFFVHFRGDAPTDFGLWVFDDCRYDLTLYYTAGARGWTDSDAYDSSAETWNGYPLALWESTVSGSCGAEGSSVTWTLDMATGTLTLSGSGATADLRWAYDSSRHERAYTPDWGLYRTFIRTAVIEEGITHLGTGTFYDHPALTSVTLPASLESLGTRVFDGCGSLSSACFYGEAPELSGDYAFRGCADDFTILYPDGAAGWTAPLWNDWPATHTRVEDNVLSHSAQVPAGTTGILAGFDANGRMVSCSAARWGDAPVLTLPLPQHGDAVAFRLFCLSGSSTPFRSENTLTDFIL